MIPPMTVNSAIVPPPVVCLFTIDVVSRSLTIPLGWLAGCIGFFSPPRGAAASSRFDRFQFKSSFNYRTLTRDDRRRQRWKLFADTLSRDQPAKLNGRVSSITARWQDEIATILSSVECSSKSVFRASKVHEIHGERCGSCESLGVIVNVIYLFISRLIGR